MYRADSFRLQANLEGAAHAPDYIKPNTNSDTIPIPTPIQQQEASQVSADIYHPSHSPLPNLLPLRPDLIGSFDNSQARLSPWLPTVSFLYSVSNTNNLPNAQVSLVSPTRDLIDQYRPSRLWKLRRNSDELRAFSVLDPDILYLDCGHLWGNKSRRKASYVLIFSDTV